MSLVSVTDAAVCAHAMSLYDEPITGDQVLMTVGGMETYSTATIPDELLKVRIVKLATSCTASSCPLSLIQFNTDVGDVPKNRYGAKIVWNVQARQMVVIGGLPTTYATFAGYTLASLNVGLSTASDIWTWQYPASLANSVGYLSLATVFHPSRPRFLMAVRYGGIDKAYSTDPIPSNNPANPTHEVSIFPLYDLGSARPTITPYTSLSSTIVLARNSVQISEAVLMGPEIPEYPSPPQVTVTNAYAVTLSMIDRGLPTEMVAFLCVSAAAIGCFYFNFLSRKAASWQAFREAYEEQKKANNKKKLRPGNQGSGSSSRPPGSSSAALGSGSRPPGSSSRSPQSAQSMRSGQPSSSSSSRSPSRNPTNASMPRPR